MRTQDYCGLDFGTSNSTVAVPGAAGVTLAPVEGAHLTLPSSLFFDFSTNETLFGRAALAAYVEGHDGRLMRSLKSVLGTSLMEETTRIKTRVYGFKDIIGLILSRVKASADAAAGTDVTRVVLGRPVHFVDENEAADRAAQNALEEIARLAGFREIVFQYEPIAAALAYEQDVAEEQYALIADIGGGTSDFSIVRVSPEGRRKADRSADVLANKGVHIGGTDIDRLLSLKAVMPALGLNSEVRGDFGAKIVPVSNGYFVDLATWHRINFLYTDKVMRSLRDIERHSLSPEKIARLIDIVEARRGHSVALAVEAAKIELSNAKTAPIDLGDAAPGVEIAATRKTLEAAAAQALRNLSATLDETIEAAGLAPGRLDAVFLTGGSTAIPAVRQAIVDKCPQARVIEGDVFGAVGLGLGLDAARKFGHAGA